MTRVKNIIIKNSKNIEGLKNFNKKFITLFNKFKNEIDTGKLYGNLKEKLKNFDPCPKILEDFYKKCQKYFSDMKTFNEFLKFNFKKMKMECKDENLKNLLKENYKILKENIKSEKNSIIIISNFDYLNDLFAYLEFSVTKETKVLEKIQKAIESYPSSRKSSNIKKEFLPLSPKEDNENRNNNNNNPNEEIENEEKNKNDKEECMENSVIMDVNIDVKSNININLDNLIGGNAEFKKENISQKSEIISKVSNSERAQEENEFSIKSNTNSHKNNNEMSENICYIAPYSGWSFKKLEEEKDMVSQKIEFFKKQIEVGKYFKSEINLKNLSKLEVPFEKTLFYFFENIEKIIANINISKNIADICISADLPVERKSPDRKSTALSNHKQGNFFKNFLFIFFIKS